MHGSMGGGRKPDQSGSLSRAVQAPLAYPTNLHTHGSAPHSAMNRAKREARGWVCLHPCSAGAKHLRQPPRSWPNPILPRSSKPAEALPSECRRSARADEALGMIKAIAQSADAINRRGARSKGSSRDHP